MSQADYLDRLREDGAALASAAGGALSAPVATCPDWDMTGLVAHVGAVHRWVAGIVRTGATEPPGPKPALPDLTDPAVVLAWYLDGLDGLVVALDQTDPDRPVWNWFDRGVAPARFWARRMAHETAVHRWDAQAAAGHPDPIEVRLAVDGIDEFVAFLAARLPRRPAPGLGGSLHLHATDVEGEWSFAMSPDHLEVRRQHTKADAALRGSASDLLLWLVNRKPADAAGLVAFGDGAITDAWRASVTF